jgi:hypothetical protein
VWAVERCALGREVPFGGLRMTTRRNDWFFNHGLNRDKMAVVSLSLIELFGNIGVPASAFDPKFDNVRGDTPVTRANTGIYGSEYYAFDAAGREYYLPVTVTYTVKGSNEVKVWELPYPVISIRSRKTIIETALTERRGTVKELININDYDIQIRGFIVNHDGNEFPEDQVITLRELYEQNVPVSIKCPLTDIYLLRTDRKGSDKVVIKSLDFPEMVGVKSVRHYVLEMVSDEPFNLIDIS